MDAALSIGSGFGTFMVQCTRHGPFGGRAVMQTGKRISTHTRRKAWPLGALGCAILVWGLVGCGGSPDLVTDQQLQSVLQKAGFTGRVESTLEKRLGRKL